jgi:integrase/recombinase XerD
MELNVIATPKGEKIPVLLDDKMRLVKPVFDFLKFQRLKNMAENTVKSYSWDLKIFYEFLSKNEICYDDVNFTNIADFIEFLRNADKRGEMPAIYSESVRTPKTINRILGTVHSFYKYHAMVGGINNPILMQDMAKPSNSMFKGMLEHAKNDNFIKKSVFKVKESKYSVRLMKEDEAPIFLEALPTYRDKLIFKTLYYTGARIAEVLDLQIENIPFPDSTELLGVFQDIKSKGKKRNLYAPMELIEELDAFVLNERSRIDTEHGHIFVSQQKQHLGKPLTYRGAYEVFQLVGKKVGIDFKFHDLSYPYINKIRTFF